MLDSHESERRPIAVDVLDNTRAPAVLIFTDTGSQAMRRLISELMDFDDVSRFSIEKITAISVRYGFDRTAMWPGPGIRRRS